MQNDAKKRYLFVLLLNYVPNENFNYLINLRTTKQDGKVPNPYYIYQNMGIQYHMTYLLPNKIHTE